MRLAAFSDIHGNPIALDAVLADIERRGGADDYVVLGDLVAEGWDPAGVCERLAALPNARFVRGNTDRHITRGDLYLTLEQIQRLAAREPERLRGFIAGRQRDGWTNGVLAATGWLDWLAAIPLEERFELPDGTRVLCVHAAPGLDDGPFIDPYTSDEVLSKLLEGCEADLVLVGHTHWPLDRSAAGVRVVNVSSVGNPLATDLRASYALIDADASGYSVELCRVAYDLEAVIAAIRSSRLFPNPETLIPWYKGERWASWQRRDIYDPRATSP